MKKNFFLLMSILVLPLILSCGGKAAKMPAMGSAPSVPQAAYVPVPDWRFEKDGIRLHIKGDSKLNLFQGDPHTLMVCIYNLKDPNAFNQLIDEKEGLAKLLECSRFDPSVTSSKRIVVQPGQDLNETMDRAEGAKYISLVAGYFNLKKEKVTRLYPIPVLEGKGRQPQTPVPGILNLDISLGPQEIEEAKGK
jgi:type VI secretion system VasD/TssJ family lipoprotein